MPDAMRSGNGLTLGAFTRQLREEADEERRRKAFIPDMGYERQEGISEALYAVRSGSPVVFISGRAGTGKSRLIRYMARMPGGERQVVVAPTGMSAMGLGASTIHTFFRLPLGVIEARSLVSDGWNSPIVRNMRRLVIDEISMVRADTLDAIDVRLREMRNVDAPFGGVQLVMIGDFLQLPPVVTDEDRILLGRLGYETPFAFSAACLQTTPIRIATLRKVWRQSDPELIEALGWIREGRNVNAALDWLNLRCAGPHRSDDPPLLLTARRDAADFHNEAGIEKLRRIFDGDPRSRFMMIARCCGSFDTERAILPAARILELYPGARVMSVRNDPAGRYANGSLGEVVGFSHPEDGENDAWVDVRFDGRARTDRVEVASWTKSVQVWDEASGEIVAETSGVCEQIPLVLGYAVTIHKSQGLSLHNVRIDLGRGAFAPGQLYVALSRATSVQGLSFVRPITPRDVQVDEMLVRFLQWARRASNLQFSAPVSKPDQEVEARETLDCQ